MRDSLLRFGLPGLLILILLGANLASLGGSKEAVRPTPAPQGEDGQPTVTYPDLPGRLIFRRGNELQLLQRQQLQRVPLPSPFTLPNDSASAFSPNGRWVAGFVKQGAETFLDAVDLETGAATRVGPAVAGQMAWSPENQRIAVWAEDRIAIYNFPGGSRSEQIRDDARVNEAVWSPDGKRLAVGFTQADGQRSFIEVLEFSRGFGGQLLAPSGSHPFWTPNGEGLVYARQLRPESPASELVLHKTEGEEVVLATADQLVRANQEIQIVGAEPYLIWVGGAYNPGNLLFTLKYYSGVNPRYAVGTISLSGAGPRVALLPVNPNHPDNRGRTPPLPCSTGKLVQSKSALLFVSHGPGCEDAMHRFDASEWKEDQVWGSTPGGALVSPDGTYWLQWQSKSMPTAVSVDGVSTKLVPLYGDPLAWDEGI